LISINCIFAIVKGMSEAEEIKSLLAFKKKLEKRIEKLQNELKEAQTILETINSILLSKGFKRAEAVVKTAPAPSIPESPAPMEAEPITPTVEFKEVFPIKADDGEDLAKIYVGGNMLRVVFNKDKAFNVNTPPFNQFLVERVLAKMQEKDGELLKAGKLTPEKVFSYTIIRDDDILREIVIKNFDAERLRDLKSSIKWTLEKMYEKMRVA